MKNCCSLQLSGFLATQTVGRATLEVKLKILLLEGFFLAFSGNIQMDTFQLIAFLLSVFNIASLMVSNVNNNNNNNNINDNEANVNDNNINESNTNAMVNSMVMVGLGGRSFGTRTEAEGEIELMTFRLVNSK